MTIGERLRAAREEHGMSIGEIARRTCIQPKFLQAIDDDNFGVLPESHRRLFVREYAKAVEVDPNEVLSLLPDHVPAPPPSVAETASNSGTRSYAPPAPAHTEHDRREYREILQRLSESGRRPFARSNAALWLIVTACLLLVAGGLYYFFVHTSEPDAADAAAAPADSSSITTPVDQTTGRTDSAAAPVAASGDSLTLEGVATAPVWYNIVMDGKRTETDKIDSGATRVWRASETFRVSLGNAGGLTLTLNGKPLGTLGQKKTIVKNQMIDATGIVKKGTPRKGGSQRRAAAAPARQISSTPLRTADGAASPRR